MTTLFHLNLSRIGEAALDPYKVDTPVSPLRKGSVGLDLSENLPKMLTKGSALGFRQAGLTPKAMFVTNMH